MARSGASANWATTMKASASTEVAAAKTPTAAEPATTHVACPRSLGEGDRCDANQAK